MSRVRHLDSSKRVRVVVVGGVRVGRREGEWEKTQKKRKGREREKSGGVRSAGEE